MFLIKHVSELEQKTHLMPIELVEDEATFLNDLPQKSTQSRETHLYQISVVITFLYLCGLLFAKLMIS
jgi:hypothetical protein